MSRPAAAASRSSSTVRTPSARPISTARLRAQAQVAADPDELRIGFPLQLLELGDRARLDELAQASLDRAADPAQFAHASRPHELGDVGRRRADEIGRPPVRANAVRARPGEVERGGERPR